MNKKFLSLVLALVMVLGTFSSVFAAAASDKKEDAKLTSIDAKVQWLIDNSIVIGNADKDGKPNGNMDLKSPIRRDAVAKMVVYGMKQQDLADKLQGVYRPFPDVEVTNSMNGYISAAASKTNNGVSVINGYEDGLFHPTKDVSYAELAKMLVVATDKDLTPAKAQNYAWPQGWMDRAAQLGILDGLSVDKATAPAVRSEAFAMIYNAFFKLKEVHAVPMNEVRGIISEHSKKGETLVLNQGDYKHEYKVNDATVFVKVGQNEKPQLWIGGDTVKNDYYVGSLVRVLVDKDGVVTHIIEMGNPVDGVNKGTQQIAWVDLGKIELKQESSFVRAKDGKGNDLETRAEDTTKAVTVGKDFVKIGGNQYNVTSKTEVYVADKGANVLTQVKDFDAAKALLPDKDVKAVYVGYEVLPNGENEARIIVFNEIDRKQNTSIVRVAKAVSSSDYLLSVEKPGQTRGNTEQFSLRDNNSVWPYNYDFDAYDVLEVTNNNYEDKAKVKTLIEYATAPIVKINKFYLVQADGTKKEVGTRAEANAVELIDKDGFVATFTLPTDYAMFFGRDLKVGAHVQYAIDNSKIEVLSAVGDDTGLRGNVEEGKASYYAKVRVIGKAVISGKLENVTVVFDGSKKEETLVAPQALGLTVGKGYELLLSKANTVNGKKEVLYKKGEWMPEKLAELTEAATELETASKAYEKEDAKKFKGELEALVKDYKALSEEEKAYTEATKAVKDRINQMIDTYNGFEGLADADKLENIK